MTGDKVKLERLGETIDVRGIDAKKQIPWKSVSAEDLEKRIRGISLRQRRNDKYYPEGHYRLDHKENHPLLPSTAHELQ